MISSIIKKEWLKLRFYFFSLVVVTIASLGYFTFNIDFSFSTIEPESMMWYRFSHLSDKPYFDFLYLYLGFSFVISLAQFLPERVSNRIKIIAHLPLKISTGLFYHLLIGGLFVFVLSAILSFLLLVVLSYYYPDVIVGVVFKDSMVFTLFSIVMYLGVSSLIIEKNKTIIVFKAILIAILFGVFFKEEFYFRDFVLLGLFLLYLPFIALDSFYSIKQQRLNSIVFYGVTFIVSAFLLNSAYVNYKENYKKEFNKYYIFYSNQAKEFVYQKNFGDHRFEYGIKDKKTFDRETYESYLPFVYWKDLAIQGKLPVSVDGKKFDKKTIKASRLGFSYNPRMLKKQEVQFFPLLNPNSTKGMIKFPEEMFCIDKKGAFIYDYDSGLVKELTEELNVALLKNNFSYPAKNIWGKSTNMKPFDKGYLVLDSKKQLFNIKRADSKIKVSKINYPKGIELVHIKLSENKQRKLSGYAIDSNNSFYLLTWDFKFIKLDLPKFDYKSMKLKLISNPLNYLIRYDNGVDYRAVVFTKEYKKIKSVKLD